MERCFLVLLSRSDFTIILFHFYNFHTLVYLPSPQKPSPLIGFRPLHPSPCIKIPSYGPFLSSRATWDPSSSRKTIHPRMHTPLIISLNQEVPPCSPVGSLFLYHGFVSKIFIYNVGSLCSPSVCYYSFLPSQSFDFVRDVPPRCFPPPGVHAQCLIFYRIVRPLCVVNLPNYPFSQPVLFVPSEPWSFPSVLCPIALGRWTSAIVPGFGCLTCLW